MAEALRAATGLKVDLENGRLRFPELGLEFWGYLIEDNGCELLSPIPAHPYTWENLDRVMTTLGGERDGDPIMWRPSPEDAALRVRWDELPSRDQRLLKLPPILPTRRLFDRFLSSRRATRKRG